MRDVTVYFCGDEYVQVCQLVFVSLSSCDDFVIFCAFAACDNKVEKHCPDSTCRATMRFDGLGFMCACNADLCNGNITWTNESDEPQLSLGLFNSGGMSMATNCNYD